MAVRGPEPVRPGGGVDLVGREIHRLHHLADGAGLDELAGLDRGAHLQPLGVHDRGLAAGLADRLSDLGRLGEGGDSRLVAEIILAVAHERGRPSGARWSGMGAPATSWILGFSRVSASLRASGTSPNFCAEVGDLLGVGSVDRDQPAAAALITAAVMPMMW